MSKTNTTKSNPMLRVLRGGAAPRVVEHITPERLVAADPNAPGAWLDRRAACAEHALPFPVENGVCNIVTNYIPPAGILRLRDVMTRVWTRIPRPHRERLGAHWKAMSGFTGRACIEVVPWPDLGEVGLVQWSGEQFASELRYAATFEGYESRVSCCNLRGTFIRLADDATFHAPIEAAAAALALALADALTDARGGTADPEEAVRIARSWRIGGGVELSRWLAKHRPEEA